MNLLPNYSSAAVAAFAWHCHVIGPIRAVVVTTLLECPFSFGFFLIFIFILDGHCHALAGTTTTTTTRIDAHTHTSVLATALGKWLVMRLLFAAAADIISSSLPLSLSVDISLSTLLNSSTPVNGRRIPSLPFSSLERWQFRVNTNKKQDAHRSSASAAAAAA